MKLLAIYAPRLLVDNQNCNNKRILINTILLIYYNQNFNYNYDN